jgi:N-acetylneuraminic acid mutarotase
MRQHQLLSAVLALSSFALASCGDQPTQPNTPTPDPTTPEFLIAHNTWVTRADRWGTELWQLAAATVTNAAGQSIVYTIGGRSATGGSNTNVMAYNVSTNTWRFRAPLPYPRWGTNGAAVINGKIYISGGNSLKSDDFPYNTLLMYDPETNTWTRKADMPTGGSDGLTGVINNKLYVLTRCVEAESSNFYSDCAPDRFYRYNPVTDRWTILPRPARVHRGPVGGVLYGKFYVMGEDIFTAGLPSTTEVYDPTTNQWADAASPPNRQVFPAGAVQGGFLYVIGGYRLRPTDPLVTGPTSIYHPLTDTWTTGAPLPTGWSGVAASKVFLDGRPRIEVVGGSRPGNNLQYIP